MASSLTPHDSPTTLDRIREEFGFVDLLARQLHRQIAGALPLEDLVAYGREGLLRAARTFDASRGVPFRAWVTLRVRGAMIDGVRSHGGIPRGLYKMVRALDAAEQIKESLLEEEAARPDATAEEAHERLRSTLATMATAMATSLVAPIPMESDCLADPSTSPEEDLERKQLLAAVRRGVGTLPEPERTLVEGHYFSGLTLDEAARSIGLSKSWGSRLHARAIEALARTLKRDSSER